MKIYPLDIVLAIAGMPFDAETIASGKSLGGSETAGFQLAEHLARLGNKVTIFCNTPKPSEGIKNLYFRPLGIIGNFPKAFFDYVRSTPHDVLLVQRLPMLFQFATQSKANLLWQHDLATKTGPSFFANVAWNLDRILVLSQFMKDQYKKVHGGTDDLYHLTRNGIDLSIIDNVPEQERDRFRLTYTARPERGLDTLLTRLFPEILKREPRARLHISRYEDVAVLPLYEQLKPLIAQFGDKIVDMSNLGKAALYENYKKSRCYVYPSSFEEISCLTSQEAAACGAVFVGPWRGALPETCGDAAVLLRDEGVIGNRGDAIDPGFVPPSDKFIHAMADWTVNLMRDDTLYNSYQRRAVARAREWTWDAVAEDWIKLSHDLIARRTDEPKRVMRHLLVSSDVVGAQKFAEKHNDPQLRESVKNYVDRFMPFMNQMDPDRRRLELGKFYEDRSGGEHAHWQTAFYADEEIRLKVLLQWMEPKVKAGEIKTVLDFGCAHGGYVRAISNRYPELKVVGMDVSPSLIRAANELKANACEHPENIEFGVGDESMNIWEQYGAGGFRCYMVEMNKPTQSCTHAKFDLVVAMEVLEHLPNAEEVAKKLERHCKPNGLMVFTVPHGLRERDELINKNVPPVHVRAFDLHDLRDMFSERKDYGVISFSDHTELRLDTSFAGWWMVFYKADGKPVGQIDWDRKFFLQAPRETVTVCMIVNNSEDVLHRCIRSVQKLADQIIVIDNGPSMDRTADVAAEYTTDVRAGTSPFYCYAHQMRHAPTEINPNECKMAGFETPRNESIEGAWGDWIWWIDSDEQLLNARNLAKYLRPNCMLGYAVRQHHISVEPAGPIRTDLPARLVRNRVGIRCYGKVHEHFELGINKGIGTATIVLPDIHIHHDGYLTEEIRRDRFQRNLRLLECDRITYPERLLGIYLFEVRDNFHMATYEMERNGGQVTPAVQHYCNTVVSAYRQHFLNKGVFFDDDGLNYYSQALTILQQGVEVAYDVDVKQNGAQITGPKRFRALDAAEAKLIINAKIDQLASACVGPYVA